MGAVWTFVLLVGMGPAAAPGPARAPVDEGPPPVTITAPRIAPQIRRDVEVRGDREYERLPGGGLRYTDPQRRFVAIIGVDGKVTFHDAPPVRFDRPGHKMAAAGDGLIESLLRPPGQHDRPERELPMPAANDISRRAFAGAETIPHGPYGPPPILLGVGGSFGGFARRSASRAVRAEFLEQTKTLREGMRRRDRDRRWDDAAAATIDRVMRIWGDPTLTATQRRAQIFALWDELAPDPSTELSEEDQQRRDRAICTQRRIERLMRTLAPEDSRHAYTSAELQRLNDARRSTRRFDPYPTPPAPVQAAPDPSTSPSGDRIVWAG